MGKKPNIKLNSITIIHSQTTEAVRLPENGDGQVTVHPALRSKLPLKRKVREGKKVHRKHKAKDLVNVNGNKLNKPKLSPKKKKRVSAPVGAEEARKQGDTAAVIEIPPSKVKKSPQANGSKRKKKKKKEVIEYSNAKVEGECNKGLIPAEIVHNPTEVADSVGKVQNWLLKSHYPILPKSKSTPAGLTDKQRSPHKKLTIRPRTDKSKSHSIGNLPNDKEKVRLQVVYKPPFKFSVKLKKPDKSGAVGARKSDGKTTRTGVIVRTVRDHEPKAKRNTVKPLVGNALVTAGSNAVAPIVSPAELGESTPVQTLDDIDSNIHTVQSDLEVLLSESEFLFPDN